MLEQEAHESGELILWFVCDMMRVKTLQVKWPYMSHCEWWTKGNVIHLAMRNDGKLKKLVANVIGFRREVDLRTGNCYTRFLIWLFQDVNLEYCTKYYKDNDGKNLSLSHNTSLIALLPCDVERHIRKIRILFDNWNAYTNV